MVNSGGSADPTRVHVSDVAIRVMIVDDHPVYRDGLAALLAVHSDLALVAEAADGEQAIAIHRAHCPDVTLMDLSMPTMGGVESIRRIIAEFPDAKIIALTTYEGDVDISRALDAGASGYLLKDIVRHELANAIRTVQHGGRVISPDLARRMTELGPREPLTDRELEVLALMAKGLSNREIAAAIGRSEGTAKVHVLHIFAKLGVDDRTRAVTVALTRGIIHLV